jgi:Flp pilus assembly protein CpaB
VQENKASRIFLIVAVVLGVLATVMAFAYIDSMAKESGGGTPVKILVAKTDLRPNAALDPDRDLQVEDMSPKFQPFAALCLTPAYKATYKGQKLNRRVLAGQPVMVADLSATAELVLPAGTFAMSLPVKGAYGVSGLPIPGDHVKVLVTQPISSGPGMMATTWEIGGGASFLVVASGNRLARIRQPFTALERADTGGESEQATVTIAVNMTQAKEIEDRSAAFKMPITLLLAPPGSAASEPAK